MGATGRRGTFNPLIAGFIAGIAIAAILVVIAKINLDFAAPWSATHTLSAQVSDVDGISVGSDVRIAGRAVGQITAVTAHGAYSTVTFHIDGSEWPLPQDTSASVRLATLLGQKYLELVPGSNGSRQLAADATIGLQATRPVVDFDQVLDTFDKPTRNALTSIIRTASGALQGQEAILQQLVPDLRDLSVHSVTPTGELVSRNQEISNILVNLGVTADRLDSSRQDLAAVIDHLNTITGALAANRPALEAYIANTDALSRTTDAVLGNGGATELNAALQRLGTTAAYLDTLMRDLLPQSNSFAGRDGTRTYTGFAPYQDSQHLVYQIGAATGQSDAQGFFLRETDNGADPCGLLICGAPPVSSQRSGSAGSGCLPLVGCGSLPVRPGLPLLPATPSLPGGSGTLPSPAPLPGLPGLPAGLASASSPSAADAERYPGGYYSPDVLRLRSF